MPVVGTKAAASSQGFGEFTTVSGPANYIEDVFSTYLYTGNGSTQTITNGINLSGKGGLVWIKHRTSGTRWHILTDSARGFSGGDGYILSTNVTNAQFLGGGAVTGFGSTGFSLGSVAEVNQVSNTFASWTFRKQPKFFDVVTYTGNGANRTIAHNLGSVPGCIIVKRTDTAADWQVYHRSLANTEYLVLNTDAAKATGTTRWNSTTPTSTVFSVGTDATVNANGGTYVAYLFAHDAGGFGTAGTDNVISCGSFTTDGSGNATVSLGYEPQWILVKRSASSGSWSIIDNMRGFSYSSDAFLYPNLTNAEFNSSSGLFVPTATGFNVVGNTPGPDTFIYIAIRRGPMKTPTSGTSVLETTAYSGNNTANRTIGTSLTTDLLLLTDRQGTSTGWSSYAQYIFDRLRGEDVALATSNPNPESSSWANTYFNLDQQIGWSNGSNYSYLNNGVTTYASYSFRRAPGFMDVVVTPGINSSNHAIPHNLGVVPELIIAKDRNYSGANWVAYSAATGQSQYLVLNLNNSAASNTNIWGSSAFTSSTFYVNDGLWCAVTGDSGVFYLFASCPGVSKVGSYTGTGATLTISCGFAARWVMIKRTDSTGNWWFWDTSRGMVAGTDPRSAMNSSAAETNANWVYTNASGFQIVTTDASVNASGGSYIFLAVG